VNVATLKHRAVESVQYGVQPGVVVRHGVAGLVATGAMSGGMAVAKLLGIMQTPPPKQIVARAEKKVDVHQDQESFSVTWLAAHVAYGTASGVVYGLVQGLLPKNSHVAGLIYGGVLWAGGYLGLMPVLGLYPFPENDDTSRMAVMIAVHGLYGETLAVLAGGSKE
jgi:hypothetical protein